MTIDEGWAFLVSLREAGFAKKRKGEQSSSSGLSSQRRSDELSLLPCCVMQSKAEVTFRLKEPIRIPCSQGSHLELGIGAYAGRLSVVPTEVDLHFVDFIDPVESQ